MADNEEFSIAKEAGLPDNWAPIAVEPVVPGRTPTNGGAPMSGGIGFQSTSDMPPYFSGSLSPDLVHDADYVRSQYATPKVPTVPLMPIAPSGKAQVNAAVQSVVNTSVVSAVDNDPYMFFRGVWNSFTQYNVNDVVIFNNSSYICVQGNTNSEPDSPVVPTIIVRQTANAGNSGGGPLGVAFANPVLAGSAIVVCVMARNIGTFQGVTFTDTLNANFKLLLTSPAVSSNEYWNSMYIATNVAGGSESVTSTWPSGDTGPGNKDIFIAEITGLATFQPDQTNSVALNSAGAPAPAYGISASSAADLIFSAANLNGGTLTGPAGFTSSVAGDNNAGIAWAQPLFVGTTSIGWNGQAFQFTSVAASLSPAGNTTSWVLIGENPVFNVSPSASQFNPFEVIFFKGSMYVCLKPTTSDPFTTPGSWALWAQGTGGVNPQSGNYTPVLGDDGRLIYYSSSSANTLTLPNPPINNGWWIAVQNVGSGVLTINRNGLNINGQAFNSSLSQNQGLLIWTDGSNYFTLNGFATVTNVSGSLTNHAIILGNGGNDVRALGSLGTTTTVLHGNATGDPSFGSVVENDQLLSDVTTDNVSTSAHGYAPKLPGDPAKFFNGSGAYTYLAVASAVGVGVSVSQNGTLRISGAVVPAGTYRVCAYMAVASHPSAGTLDVNIGWNDGIAPRTATNGTNGMPADISTAALNFAQGETIVEADGINDITWAMTLT
jgi:hypothetical protein